MEDADSPLWSVRADAGRRLAASAELVEVADVLHQLLLDAQDTAVTQETSEALLARGDIRGLRTVLAALSCAADTWTLDQLSAAVDCDPNWMTEEGESRLIQQLQELAADDYAGVRSEAERLLKPILRHTQSRQPCPSRNRGQSLQGSDRNFVKGQVVGVEVAGIQRHPS